MDKRPESKINICVRAASLHVIAGIFQLRWALSEMSSQEWLIYNVSKDNLFRNKQ